VPGRVDVSEVAIGYNHACVIDSEGALYCWGSNSFGQLGVGDQDDRDAPARVGDDSDWLSISAGRFHSCGVREGGVLQCWGAASFGQIAQIGEPVLEPDTVAAPSGAWLSVSAGQWHTCGLTNNGQVYCWGYSLLGRLGNSAGAGTEEDPEENVAKPALADAPGVVFASISAGASHTCAADELGRAWCWGSGEDGRLGTRGLDECALDASLVPCALEPQLLDDGNAYPAGVSAGGAHACAIDARDALWCWGDGSYGQLGIGDVGEPSYRSAPVQLDGSYRALAAGGSHTCAIDGQGVALCFGDGSNGQLGGAADAASEPVPVELDHPVRRVAAGILGGCAITESGDCYCWGFSAYAQSSVPERLFQ
jgi:alpha-tubulin suppressor-like RCC1 family protein